jgi:hypothetical protein
LPPHPPSDTPARRLLALQHHHHPSTRQHSIAHAQIRIALTTDHERPSRLPHATDIPSDQARPRTSSPSLAPIHHTQPAA